MEKLERIIDKKGVILLKEIDSNLIKVINGLLNTKGGIILIGLDPTTKEIEGITDLNKSINTILNIINKELDPSPKDLIDVSILSEEDKVLIKINVLKGTYKLYSIKKYGYTYKGCYYYKDNKSKCMSMNLISSRLETKDNTYEKILELIKEYPTYPSTKIGDMMNMSMRNTQRYIKYLKENNYIERKGSNKTGRWVVNDKDNK